MKLKVSLIITFISLFCIVTSCRYSLSGYEINAKTAKVEYFENRAPIQSAQLSQIFTNKLESKIIRETPLSIVTKDPEIEFSGAIIGYRLSAAAVSGVEQTEKMQLTVTVNVNYSNKNDEEKNFSQSFSASETFDADKDLSSVETQLLESITEQIVQAIFNRAFIDW